MFSEMTKLKVETIFMNDLNAIEASKINNSITFIDSHN